MLPYYKGKEEKTDRPIRVEGYMSMYYKVKEEKTDRPMRVAG
jgi:hypothetical protein